MTNRFQNVSDESNDLFRTYELWSTSNWEQSLQKHDKIIMELINKIKLFNIWTHILIKHNTAKNFLPEIFFDAYTSIHYSCMGLYKYANMCSRSELENSLRLVYFSTHPIEYGWWLKEKSTSTNPWKDWGYFSKLEKVQLFNSSLTHNQKFEDSVRNCYKNLSEAVHTNKKDFQTRSGEIKPKYALSQFKPWEGKFRDVQTQIHTIFILNFTMEFNTLDKSEKREIINYGIDFPQYRKILRKLVQI